MRNRYRHAACVVLAAVHPFGKLKGQCVHVGMVCSSVMYSLDLVRETYS